MDMEIKGIAHIALTVSNFRVAREFYGQLLPHLGLSPVLDVDGYYYCVGGHTGIAIQHLPDTPVGDRFQQSRTGLHHFCLRMQSREDVDELHRLALDLGAHIVHGPRDDAWAEGYYSVLFEDLDGIRIEANFVPGKGLLENRGQVNLP
jgi:catechol 2,3-dioxygenase-like lactoylglutathione lyase family enzyme